MKRFFLSLTLVAVMILLAGCVSIPLGDDVLEISTDGVKLIKGDSDAAGDEADKTEDVDNDEDGIDEEDEVDNEDEVDEEDEGDDDSDADDDKTSTSGKAQGEVEGGSDVTCPDDFNTDYSRIIEEIDHEFYFPECAGVAKMEKGNTFQFRLLQAGGDYEDLFDEYLDFAEEPFREDINLTNGTADLRFYLHDIEEEIGSMIINFRQEEDHVRMDFSYRYPEESEDD